MKNNSETFSPLEGFCHLVASTQLLIKEIYNRGGSVEVLDKQYNLIEITLDDKVLRVLGTTYTHTQSLLNHLLCNNKRLCKEHLQRENFQTPNFQIFRKGDRPERLKLKFPVVLKPLETNHGIDIFSNINSLPEFIEAYNILFQSYDEVMAEQFIDGSEYRFLVIEGEVIGVIKRVPANLKGDGIHTLKELFELKNKFRGKDYTYPLIKIQRRDFKKYLEKSNFSTCYIPKKNEIHKLHNISNLSKGGDSIDVTEEISEHHKKLAINICEKFNLPFAGIDFIIPDLKENYYEVLEINERPMISMHSFPYKGRNRHAEKYLLDHLLKN